MLRPRRGAEASAARHSVAMSHDDSRTDESAPLDAAEEDPTLEQNLGAGPAPTEAAADDAGPDDGAEDIPPAPAGPGATPAEPDQPLNPA